MASPPASEAEASALLAAAPSSKAHHEQSGRRWYPMMLQTPLWLLMAFGSVTQFFQLIGGHAGLWMSVFAFTLQLYLLASHIWDYRFAPEAVPDQEAEANYRCPLGPPSPANPLAFLDIEIGGDLVGRIVLELKLDVVPKTSQNFAENLFT